MFRLLTIARREWCAMVVTKAFLFTLVMMPILMFGGIVLLPMLSKLGGKKERQIVIVDGTESLFAEIQQAARLRNEMIEASIAAEAKASDAAAKRDPKDRLREKNPFETPEVWNFQKHDSDVLTNFA